MQQSENQAKLSKSGMHAQHRTPVVVDSPLFSSVCDDPELFLRVVQQRGFQMRIMRTLCALGRKLAGRSQTPTAADTQSVKTTESDRLSGCNADKKVKGRKRHRVDVERLRIETALHGASVQERNGAPAAVLGMLEAALLVRKLRADGEYRESKLATALKDLRIESVLEIVENPKDAGGFAVIYRRCVAKRIFAWMSSCRRLAKDCERSLETSLAWAKLAA